MVTDSDKKYSICVYCASGPVDESFLALAARWEPRSVDADGSWSRVAATCR